MNGEDFRSKLREFHLRRSEEGPQEKKVILEDEKKMSNACCVKLYLEDHTIGIVEFLILKRKFSENEFIEIKGSDFLWLSLNTSTSTYNRNQSVNKWSNKTI